MLIIFLIFIVAFVGIALVALTDSALRIVLGTDKEERKIYESISTNAGEYIKPDEHKNGHYIDLNKKHVSPSALLADYDNRMLCYYYEDWGSFSQKPPAPYHVQIPFKDIIGFELKRRRETVFNSSAISSAATGYAFAGTIGAAVMSGISEKDDVRKHERDKRMDMAINIITSSPQTPLVVLPLTKNGPFSSASNEVIDQTTEEILAILQQIVTLNQRAVEQEPAPELVEEAPVMRRRRRATSNDKISKLRELKDLLDSGTITQEEFDSLKREIIG